MDWLEDECDDQLNKNAMLFLSVRMNSPIDSKIRNVTRCLEQGGDVNSADGNDDDNTPLHVVARRGEVAIVRLLLDKGADVTCKNWNGHTALDIALKYHTQNSDIIHLLESAEKLAGDDPLKYINNNSQSNNIRLRARLGSLQSMIKKVEDQNKDDKDKDVINDNEIEHLFNKRKGTSGALGFLYEIRLLSLILIRALNNENIEDFYLGSNIDGIGALDDICLSCRVKNQETPFKLFMQTKHREDPKKTRLTVKEVNSLQGDLSLYKHFESYVMIENKFQTKGKDFLFQGNLIDVCLVLYTSANVSDCFQKKMKTEPNVNQKMHYLIDTNPKANPFQYKYDEGEVEILAKHAIKEELKKMGEIFIESIAKDSISKQYGVFSCNINNKYISKYHVVMGREVLQQQGISTKSYREWKFRPEFFESECEYLEALWSTFVKEISTKHYDRSKTTQEDKNNLIEALKKPSAFNISKVIGKLLIYNEENKKLQLIKITVFETGMESKKLQEYFSTIELKESVVREAVRIKLTSMTIRLPLEFGNVDMTFYEDKKDSRIKNLTNTLVYLFANLKDTMVIDIKDDMVGQRIMSEHSITLRNGGIGSAVGNLLIFDAETNSLKFNLDENNKPLPDNAALLLKELKEVKYNNFSLNENLTNYRIRVNNEAFPIYSFEDIERDKRRVRNYLNKLLFYASQAKEDEVERIVKHHINEFYHGSDRFTISPDSILLRVQDEIQKWSLKSGRVKYLSRASDPFKLARKQFIDDLFKCVS